MSDLPHAALPSLSSSPSVRPLAVFHRRSSSHLRCPPPFLSPVVRHSSSLFHLRRLLSSHYFTPSRRPRPSYLHHPSQVCCSSVAMCNPSHPVVRRPRAFSSPSVALHLTARSPSVPAIRRPSCSPLPSCRAAGCGRPAAGGGGEKPSPSSCKSDMNGIFSWLEGAKTDPPSPFNCINSISWSLMLRDHQAA